MEISIFVTSDEFLSHLASNITAILRSGHKDRILVIFIAVFVENSTVCSQSVSVTVSQ